MDEQNFSIPPGYTIIDGSIEMGYLTLESPLGTQYIAYFNENQCTSIEPLTTPPFKNDFGVFL